MRRLLRSIRRFLSEARRRNVYRVALAYLAAGFVVVELADIAGGTFDLPGWFGPMVWVLVGLGFPIALILAWALEVTPEGVRVDVPEGPEEEIPRRGGFSFISTGLIVGLLILAVGLVLYPRVFSSGTGTGEDVSPASTDTAEIGTRSIAVLPFEPLSAGKKSKTFARGIHDDLLTRLANVSDLEVISRTAVQQYRNTELSTREIADSLGVRWVMEGGVQVIQNQIQVNAQLINPRTETHVWADDYRRDLTAEDLFAIQGEITREITEALKAELTAGEQERIAGAPTRDLKAYRLYVQGRQLLASREVDSIRRAKRYFKQALAEDSTYALAWVGLADARVLYANYGSAPDERVNSIRAVLPEAEAAARRALKLDSDLADAHASLGHIYEYDNLSYMRKYSRKPDLGKGPEALWHLQRAVELKPSYAEAQHWLGTLQLALGRPAPALKHLQLAVELSPNHQSATRYLTMALLANGKYEAALATARRLESMYPGSGQALEGAALVHLRRWAEAREQARQRRSQTKDPPPWTVLYPALADAALGDTTSARKRIQKLHARANEVEVAWIHAALGEVDAAFRALPEIRPWAFWTLPVRYFYPDLLSAFRKDSRYETLIEQINQAWGLNPDGSIPEETAASSELQTDL